MKSKRTIGIFFGALLLSMTTTGCNYFPSFVSPELSDLEIVADPLKTFVKGDVFEDCLNLSIIGHYTNKKTKAIPTSDVELVYVSEDTGVGYSIGREIPSSGNYYLRAKYNNITSSKVYEFSAIDEHCFATGVTLRDDETIMVAPSFSQSFSFDVQPTDCTERLFYEIQDQSIAKIKSVKNSSLEIEGLKAGATSLLVSTYANEKHNLITQRIPVIIEAIYVKKIEFESRPNTMLVGDEDRIVLKFTPEKFTVPVKFSVSNTKVTKVEQYYNYLYPINALDAGTSKISFTAASGRNRTFTLYCTVTVKHVYPSIFATSGYHSVGISRTIDIKLLTVPNQLTVRPELQNDYDVKIVKVNRKSGSWTQYEVTGISYGKVKLHWKIKNGTDTYLHAYHTVEVKTVYATNLTISYDSDFTTIPIGSDFSVKVDVAPGNFTSGYSAFSDNPEIAELTVVEKFKEYKITGVSVGQTNIHFIVDTEGGIIHRAVRINVVKLTNSSNYPVTSIKQTYSSLTKINKNQAYLPSSGNIKVLVLPIWFADSDKFYCDPDDPKKESIISNTKKQLFSNLESMFFDEINSSEKWESVKTYYEKESFGKIKITGTVADWYEYSLTATEYKDGPSKRELINQALKKYFDNHPEESRKDYDCNGDGFIDVVVSALAAPSFSSYDYGGQRSMKLYTQAFHLIDDADDERNIKNPGINAGINLINNNFGYTNASGLPYSQIAIHEFGHLFGVKDYYDESGNVNHSGGLNMQTHNCNGHEPFSLMSIGWANPIIPTETCTIKINDFQSSHDFILLTPQWNSNDSAFDEYLLLELFTPTGLNRFNSSANYTGIRLWHVNATLYNKSKKQMTDDVSAATSFAFNNDWTTDTRFGGNNGGCASYELNKDYQKYSLLHLIRHDSNAMNTLDLINDKSNAPISYDINKSQKEEDLFQEGDMFDMNAYRRQFVSYYLRTEYYLNTFIDQLSSSYTDYQKQLLIQKYQSIIDSEFKDATAPLDFGQHLCWKFFVNKIEQNNNNTWSATITFVKTAY